MILRNALALACLMALPPDAAPADDAAALLGKAAAAFRSNKDQEKHWNWAATETRELAGKSGKIVQQFPSLKSESVMQSDGRRCNALVAWGDGKAPYLADADPDVRCQAMQFGPPFDVETLLQSRRATVSAHSANGITLQIQPNKTWMNSTKDPLVRCAASIQASVLLDPATFFPRQIEGEVAGTGCDVIFQPVLQYDTGRRTGPMQSNFRKGATFRMEYALQKDKFQNPANSFWICVAQHYSLPHISSAQSLYYWGRQFTIKAEGHHLIKDIRTTAQEFGAETQLLFK